MNPTIKHINGTVLYEGEAGMTTRQMLEKATTSKAYLGGANLYGANLVGAYLVGANLRGANLGGAYLVGANLRGANLGGADLRGANLVGANLRGANLVGAYLVGAYLGEKFGKLIEGRPLFQCGPIGSRSDFLMSFITDKGIVVKAGCFTGFLDEFVAAVEKTHGDSDHGKEYAMTALMIVANQYGLNPWTKEIYAFPDKNNGIVPVVGVDGWSRIINSHPQFDGMDFEQDSESCTCVIYRKDRSHPTKVTEWMAECKRTNVGPWISHPYRMLRHKAMIQCARLAFGFVGIYEQDEAERIIESSGTAKSIDPATGEIKPSELPIYSDEAFGKNLPTWRGLIESGKKTADQIVAMVSSKATMTNDQIAMIRATVSNTVDAE